MVKVRLVKITNTPTSAKVNRFGQRCDALRGPSSDKRRSLNYQNESLFIKAINPLRWQRV